MARARERVHLSASMTLMLAIVSMAMMASIGLVSARKHDLKISADSRKSFTIESFGFVAGGTIDLTISRFSMSYLVRAFLYFSFLLCYCFA